MGELFYGQLGLSQGMPVVTAPDINLGGFNNVQPYLYWSCEAPKPLRTCQGPPPAPGFEWTFSFGNGFQGTDVIGNNLYVMVYFPATAAQALDAAITSAFGAASQLNAFITQADRISSARSDQVKASSLGAFINHVNAERGRALTAAEANQLIALAQAV